MPEVDPATKVLILTANPANTNLCDSAKKFGRLRQHGSVPLSEIAFQLRWKRQYALKTCAVL